MAENVDSSVNSTSPEAFPSSFSVWLQNIREWMTCIHYRKEPICSLFIGKKVLVKIIENRGVCWKIATVESVPSSCYNLLKCSSKYQHEFGSISEFEVDKNDIIYVKFQVLDYHKIRSNVPIPLSDVYEFQIIDKNMFQSPNSSYEEGKLMLSLNIR